MNILSEILDWAFNPMKKEWSDFWNNRVCPNYGGPGIGCDGPKCPELEELEAENAKLREELTMAIRHVENLLDLQGFEEAEVYIQETEL